MKLIKLSGGVAVALLAGLALHMFCYEPYRCSIAKNQAQTSTATLVGATDTLLIAATARRNLERLIAACDRCCDHEVDLHMIRAANYRLLKRYDEAILEYETALHYDRRPEIYLNLGETLLQSGRRDEGIQQIVNAIEFDPTLFESALSPGVKQLVYPAYRKILAGLAQR